MLKIKKCAFVFLFSIFIVSCDNHSDVIVKIYGAYEYNCTTDQYRVLSNNPILPFMKKKKWYTKEEFHESHVKHTLKSYKDLPMSEDSLNDIKPKEQVSYSMLSEFTQDVDCTNPKDIMF